MCLLFILDKFNFNSIFQLVPILFISLFLGIYTLRFIIKLNFESMNIYLIRYYLIKPFLSWRNKYLKHITRLEAKKNKLYDKAVAELETYTKESSDKIRHKHQLASNGEPGIEIFNQQSQLSKENVEQFYKQCKYYLYELPLWNAETNRPAYLYLIIKSYLKKYGCHKVLDFGGGTGDLCLELAQRDLDVTYCDIGEHVFNFARWRFERRKLKVYMVKSLDVLEDQSFDAVISFDCFEHLKDLQKFVMRLASLVRSGGLLITSDAFSGGGVHLEENQKYGNFQNLNSLMNSVGLIFIGKFAQYYFYKKL